MSTASGAVHGRDARRRRRVRLERWVVAELSVVIAGNAAILGASAWARRRVTTSSIAIPLEVLAIGNFEAVDERVWRGRAPDDAAYRALAAAGMTTIVDLRAERGIHVPDALIEELGLVRLAIPVRDGQAPTATQVERFVAAVAASTGPVYVHCGAGVGRTGTMVAAHRITSGGSRVGAVRANLAIGPPTLEQLAFAAFLRPGEPARPAPRCAVWLSRVLDAPRRTWHVLEALPDPR